MIVTVSFQEKEETEKEKEKRLKKEFQDELMRELQIRQKKIRTSAFRSKAKP